MRSNGSSRNISILPELIDANLLALDGHVMQKVIWACNADSRHKPDAFKLSMRACHFSRQLHNILPQSVPTVISSDGKAACFRKLNAKSQALGYAVELENRTVRFSVLGNKLDLQKGMQQMPTQPNSSAEKQPCS